jgi:uncharacterized MAPEG superfamily protein
VLISHDQGPRCWSGDAFLLVGTFLLGKLLPPGVQSEHTEPFIHSRLLFVCFYICSLASLTSLARLIA